MLMKVVRYGLNMTGATSEAYWAATLWKAPHGIPLVISKICKTGLTRLTAKDFSRNQDLDVGSEEQSEDGPNHHDQESQSRDLRAVSIRDPTGDDQADNFTSSRTIR
jgi:hypothetical protein